MNKVEARKQLKEIENKLREAKLTREEAAQQRYEILRQLKGVTQW